VTAALLPATAAHLFPEYDSAALDPQRAGDAEVIIERLLEGGTREEVRRLFAAVGIATVADFIRRRGVRALSRRAFAYWRVVLRIDDYQHPPWMEDREAYPNPAPGLWGR